MIGTKFPAHPLRGVRLGMRSMNSQVRVYDADGVLIATIDPLTRERRDVRGRLVGRHPLPVDDEERRGRTVAPPTLVKRSYEPVAPRVSTRGSRRSWAHNSWGR